MAGPPEPDTSCNNCGNVQWGHLLSNSQAGRKSADRRNETEKHVFVCQFCNREGRRFVDGVDGTVTRSGALR